MGSAMSLLPVVRKLLLLTSRERGKALGSNQKEKKEEMRE